MNFQYRKTVLGFLAVLLLAACGGGSSDNADTSNPTPDPTPNPAPDPEPGPVAYTLTLKASGLPTGITLPVTDASSGANLGELSADNALLPLQGNSQIIKLGKPVVSNSQQYLISCDFGESASGAIKQDDGSLRITLDADAEQPVQCQQKIFVSLQSLARSVNDGITGYQLLTANADGSAAAWLPGATQYYSSSYSASRMAALLNNEVFYGGREDDINSSTAFELRATDGTEAGTRLVKDIAPGYGGDNSSTNVGNTAKSSSPSDFLSLGDLLYFIATPNGVGGVSSLYLSDGTESGTKQVSLDGASFSTPSNLTVAGDKLFFTTQNKLYTVSGSGTIEQVHELPSGSVVYLKGVGSKLFFSTYYEKSTGNWETEVWVSDGSSSGTKLLDGVSASIGDAVALNGEIYFLGQKSGNSDSTLLKSDGDKVEQVAPVRAENLTTVGESLYFTAYDEQFGTELFVSDGTTAGTRLVKDIMPNGDSNPSNLTAVNGKLLFMTKEGVSGLRAPYYLWVSDGTEAGTMRLASTDEPDYVLRTHNTTPWEVLSDERLLFAIREDSTRNFAGTWISDGTPKGTKRIKDVSGTQIEVYSSARVVQ